MGNSALLAQPKVEKETEGATNGTISWGACSMQGWRRSMEDAHAGVLDMAVGSSAGQGGVHFFAVYDGHGGSEVATYCGRHLHSELLQHDEFKEGGDVGRAIGETFIEMDRKIVGAVAKKEMLDLDESSDSFSRCLIAHGHTRAPRPPQSSAFPIYAFFVARSG
jgi:protein phosphatase 1G